MNAVKATLLTTVNSSVGLFEEVVRYTPDVPALIGKQLRTRHVEYLPSIIPHAGVLLPIRLDQVRPYFLLVCEHLAQPVLGRQCQPMSFLYVLVMGKMVGKAYLACFGIMLSVDPPLFLDLEVPLKEEEQVGGWHGASREEVRCHPALLAKFT